MKRIIRQVILFTIFSLITSYTFAIDIIKLEPLKHDEFLQIKYENGILAIEKCSKETISSYYTCESSWGAWNISGDKRKVLIYENGMYDLYLMDGNSGSITYKGNFNQLTFPDASYKYLITSRFVPEDSMVNLFVLDFETMQELYNFPWNAQRENFKKFGWLTFKFYRSLNEKYDFVIYALGESGEQLGYSYLNATTRDFEEHNTPSDEHPSKSPYENGWE
jgi:hypothetical protein